MGPEDNEGSFGGQRDVGPDVGPTRECPSQRPSGAEVGGGQCHVIQTVGIFPPFRGALEKCRAYVIVLICGPRGASASTLELALVSTSGPHPDFLFCPVCRFLSFLLPLLFTLHTLHLLQHKTTQHKIFFVIFMNNIYYVFFYFELEMILCLG